MKFTHILTVVALPTLASAASFVRGNRVSEDTFDYDIDKCTDAKPCSLYLVRLSDMQRVATIFEKKAGAGFTAKIQNVPSGTYVFQVTGGEDGVTRVTTQFTFHTNLVTTTATLTMSSTGSTSTSSEPGSTSSNTGSTSASTVSSTGISTGTSTDISTGTSTDTSTGTSTDTSTGTSASHSTGPSTASLTSSSAGGTPTENCSAPNTTKVSSTATSTAPSGTTSTPNDGSRAMVNVWEAAGFAAVMQWLFN